MQSSPGESSDFLDQGISDEAFKGLISIHSRRELTYYKGQHGGQEARDFVYKYIIGGQTYSMNCYGDSVGNKWYVWFIDQEFSYSDDCPRDIAGVPIVVVRSSRARELAGCPTETAGLF